MPWFSCSFGVHLTRRVLVDPCPLCTAASRAALEDIVVPPKITEAQREARSKNHAAHKAIARVPNPRGRPRKHVPRGE